MNIFNKLIKKYKDWRTSRALFKEINTTTIKVNDLFLDFHEEQEAVKTLYQEGVNRIKNKVHNGKYTEDFLKDKDLLVLAQNEDKLTKEKLNKLKDIYIYKTEKIKEKMVENRIEHYYQLQNYNEERQLIKDIKKARKDGNEELANNLEKQWATKYRRIRTT